MDDPFVSGSKSSTTGGVGLGGGRGGGVGVMFGFTFIIAALEKSLLSEFRWAWARQKCSPASSAITTFQEARPSPSGVMAPEAVTSPSKSALRDTWNV